MTAPDPELADLIAAHWYNTSTCMCTCGWSTRHLPESDDDTRIGILFARHLALVVEQHTNGRITGLREHVEELAARGLPADLNPTVLGKADYVWWSNYLRRIDQTVRSNARAALEGEQQ